MPKFPKSCSRCHSIAKVDDAKRACEKFKWTFSLDLAKAQALCDDRTNAELEVF